MSLTELLPRPKYSASATLRRGDSETRGALVASGVPPYGSAAREAWRPRGPESFGEGGALPEVHEPQFPLGMGRTESRELAQIRVDVHGAVSYDSVVTQDMRREQKVYASYADLLPKQVAQEDLALPSEEQLEETTEKTRKALEALTQKSVSAAKPRAASHAAAEEKEPVYYRYTPSSKQASASQTPDQRIIRIHEMPVDPLEPPKFKHKKAPARPPSPPVPVLHSPPKKLTPEDRKNWMIPPCISNWKNIKGYTVSAEKRLVADGRGMLELEVNDKFAHFADALYQAERAAAQALQEKAKMRKNIALKQKEVREQELRELARQAREKAGSASVLPEEDDSDQVDEEDVEALEERETLRKEMRRERRREIRMHNKGTKREKRDRELERDISERVALGQLGPSSAPSGESLFDHRLFNQTQGLSTGYGADDTYNLYDKPLFTGGSSTKIYRPRAQQDAELYGDEDVERLLAKSAKRFRPEKGFEGADEETAEPRSAPVQFEQESPAEDVFGIEKFLSDAKSGRKTALDSIGSRGFMKAAGGSSSTSDRSSYSRGRKEFVESRSK